MADRPAAGPPAAVVECIVDDEAFLLDRVGASLHGWVYRARGRAAFVRLLPIGEASFARRVAIRRRISQEPVQGVAAIRRDFLVAPDDGYYAVEYETPQDARTLAEVLRDDGVPERVERLAAVLRFLPAWSEQVLPPLLPTPVDIVFDAQGAPTLLAVPPGRPVGFSALFVEPSRISYLAPEYVRGTLDSADPDGPGHLDRYAVGMSMLQGLCDVNLAERPEDLLLAVATGQMANVAGLPSRLPGMLNIVPAAREWRALVEELCAMQPTARSRRPWVALADTLQACGQQLEPGRVMRKVRREMPPATAFFMLQSLLAESESYDLLMQGAEIAEQLFRPLEAISYYDRAFALDPAAPAAHAAEFELITGARTANHPLQRDYLQYDDIAALLDQKMVRCFDALSSLQPAMIRRLEVAVAQHYLWRARELKVFFQNAGNFIRPRLFDGSGAFLDWKLEMNLAFCEALAGQDRLSEACDHLINVDRAISRYRNKPQVDPAEIRRAELWADRLRQRCSFREVQHGS